MANLELNAGETPAREGFSLDFSFVVSGVWPLIVLGFLVRIVPAAIHGTAFTIDTGTFEAWSLRLADRGPWNFYARDYFSDYAPGYLYVLFLVGKLNTVFEFSKHEFQFIFKLPSIFADLGIAWVLYHMLEGRRTGMRLGVAAIYLFFPPALLMGAIWGQVDSLSVFFLILSVYWIGRDRPLEGTAAYVVGFVIKPQIIAALPFLAFWIMRKHPLRWVGATPEAWQWLLGWALLTIGAVVGAVFYAMDPDKYGTIAAVGGVIFLIGWGLLGYVFLTRRGDLGTAQESAAGAIPAPPVIWLKAAVVGFGVMLVLILPFFPDNPWGFITQLKDAADVENYRVGSFWAYNFWGMAQDFFKPDNVDSCLANPSCTGAEFWGIEYRYWGIALFAVNVAVILYMLRNAHEHWALALGTALCLLAFYMFLTRMHERYMFPALVPLLAACALSRSRVLWVVFAVLGVMQFLNLYQVYGYYQPNELRIQDLYQYFERPKVLSAGILPDWNLQRWLSFVTFLAFPVALVTTYVLANPLRRAGTR